ncbi:hypothetical protein COO91_04284 [Nostoc flagelliforme CCNUN1]|uniref:Uncharacterized protein n=1 Tax=Nostoc flagelliforme CCNUN1 TaxID=2038116 RepID=A0A2K8SS80_9NOSO|nr:hypothetical protein COO91_04284 [Nostoc flagelliforme CCNUN1]
MVSYKQRKTKTGFQSLSPTGRAVSFPKELEKSRVLAIKNWLFCYQRAEKMN